MVDLAAAMAAATPGSEAVQTHTPAAGGGSLEASRGSSHVGTDSDLLDGELTAFGGNFNSAVHAASQSSGIAWTDQSWDGATWSGGTWSGATWSGATWSGATWSGATWSGATWSGATWSGATWA
jgi:serine protease AprX